MEKTAYTYAVVRYLHDPASGEILNIGVLLYAPDVHFFGFRLQRRYRRLSAAFAGFDAIQYRRTVRQTTQALKEIESQIHSSPNDLPAHVGQIADRLWPDSGLSFGVGTTRAGITDNPQEALEALYQRMVLAPAPCPTVNKSVPEYPPGINR